MNDESKIVLLTFDVEGPPKREDFIDQEILTALYHVLRLLTKYDLKGLFFITELAAQKISCYPKMLRMLESHEIGYHSSSHSVKPGIFEYTDIKNYEKAVQISIERETSSIAPFTGNIEGKGGIISLRQKFPNKKITSFRAPFLCWSPPHLEALRELGIRFDFSADICSYPLFHKGITFFPYPIVIDSAVGKSYFIFRKIFRREFTVLLLHPSLMLFKEDQSIYRHYKNPYQPVRIEKHASPYARFRLSQLELFLSGLNLLRKHKFIKVETPLEVPRKFSTFGPKNVARICEKSTSRARKHLGYKPRFLKYHFHHFFKSCN